MKHSVASLFSIAALSTLAVAAPVPATAEPDPGSGDAPAVTEFQVPPEALTMQPLAANPVSDACRQFNAALNLAAANYEDFAYATAGNGDYVNYQDPTVGRSNLVGRTALREAAAAALQASRAPGLPDEVAAPMRSWSLHATKLLVIMGLHAGGDSLNDAATTLNTDGNNAQMACASAGVLG